MADVDFAPVISIYTSPDAAALVVVDHTPMDVPHAEQHDALPAPEPPADHDSRTKTSSSRVLAKVDSVAAHLSRCLQTPAGIDAVLLLVCYSTRLSAAVVENVAKPSPKMVAFFMNVLGMAKVQSSAKSAVSITTSGRGAPLDMVQLLILRVLPRLVTRLSLFATRLKAMSSLTSDARTFTRLWSLLGLYLWARKLQADSKTGTLDRIISWTQLASCVGLSVLESGSFLSHRNVLGWTPAQQQLALRWSTRFWTAYVGVELARLAVDRVRNSRRFGAEIADLGRREHQHHGMEFGSEKTVLRNQLRAKQAERAEWDGRWKGDMIRNLAWAPLTIHWGIDGGLVSETVLSMLGCIPGIVQTRQLWKDTAVPHVYSAHDGLDKE